MPEINFSENDYIETENKATDYYRRTNKKVYSYKNIKKLAKIENMAHKKNCYRRYK